jgi:hypothetical protein
MIGIVLIVGIALCVFDGILHGGYYEQKFEGKPVEMPFDEHYFFGAYRALVGILILIAGGATMLLAIVMCFSFFHNGSYYLTRNHLTEEDYPDGWWSQSDKTSAIFSVKPLPRTIIAICGIIVGVLASL